MVSNSQNKCHRKKCPFEGRKEAHLKNGHIPGHLDILVTPFTYFISYYNKFFILK